MKALEEIEIVVPDPLTQEAVHLLFRSARKPKDGTATPAGPAARRKGEFALALAGLISDARRDGTPVTVPGAVSQVFEFLFATLTSEVGESASVTADSGSDGGAAGDGSDTVT